MSSNYAHLPPHIIVKILNLLHLNDFKNAIQICKQWYNVSCCPTIGRRIKIHLIGDVNKSHKSIKRPFNRLELTEVNLSDWNYKEFLKKFTFSIRELQVIRCTITFNKLVKCLKYLPNLESLLVEVLPDAKFKKSDNACSKLSNPLNNMKVFTIKCVGNQCSGLNFVLSKCINLKELTYCASNSTNSRDNRMYVNMCNAMAHWPSVNLTSLTIKKWYSSPKECGKAILQRFVPNSFLVIDYEMVDITTFFKGFRRIKHVAVKRLNLADTSEERDWVEFDKFCKKLPGLEELEMCSVDDLDLLSIRQFFRKLRLLCFSSFNGRQLGLIGGFHNLEILCVMAFNENQNHLIHLATSNMPNLKVLKLARVKISKTVLNMMCANFTNLLKLDLCLNTHDCGAIFKYQQKLKMLNLYFWDTCPEPFEDVATEYTCTNLKQVMYMNITKYVPGLTEQLIYKMESLKFFVYIEDYDINDYQNFTYDDQREILDSLKNIQ